MTSSTGLPWRCTRWASSRTPASRSPMNAPHEPASEQSDPGRRWGHPDDHPDGSVTDHDLSRDKVAFVACGTGSVLAVAAVRSWRRQERALHSTSPYPSPGLAGGVCALAVELVAFDVAAPRADVTLAGGRGQAVRRTPRGGIDVTPHTARWRSSARRFEPSSQVNGPRSDLRPRSTCRAGRRGRW